MADDPAYANSAKRRDNQRQLIAVVAARLKQEGRTTWLERMRAAGVACGAIRTVGEAMDAPEIRELGLISEIPHPTLGSIPNVGLPIHFTETPLADPVAAPTLGANTDEVLRRLLGYSEGKITELAKAARSAEQPFYFIVPGSHNTSWGQSVSTATAIRWATTCGRTPWKISDAVCP